MKRIFRGASSLILALVLLLSTIVPAFANEQALPDISNWALAELNEGEKYGIFPMDWYYDDFRGEISVERLKMLFELTEEKIALLSLEKNGPSSSIYTFQDNTRKGILEGLFTIISQYDFASNQSAIPYMKARKIINGTGKGLELERAATTEEAILLASRLVKDTYYQVQAGSKGVAWVVENQGTTVYLLGSIHIGIPNLYPFNEKLITAYKNSDALLVEANLFDFEGLLYFTEASMFQDGRTLKDVVSEETYEKVIQVLEKYELPEDEYTLYKPWSLASLLSNLSTDNFSGVDQMAAYGIDMFFLSDAFTNNKPIGELEGMKAQTDMFEGLSNDAQEKYLSETVEAILVENEQDENPYEIFQQWFNYWSTGDKENFKNSLNTDEGEASEFEKMLFGDRDKNMANKIIELLNSGEKGTYFIVVGAGHFLYDESILYHLQEQGYQVKEFYN